MTLENELLLPTPSEIGQQIPFSIEEQHQVAAFRKTIANILNGEDSRLLLIVGPCSIHCTEQALAYAEHLKAFTPKIHSRFFPVMRVYYEKPRTSLGWQGFLHDPHLDGTHKLLDGIQQTRGLLKKITELGVPIAAEFVTPMISSYFEDFISWGSIGARTATSQIHRQLASSLPMPVGIKNDIFGQVMAGIQALKVSIKPQTYLGLDKQGKGCIKTTKGNSLSHLVLRGGTEGPNYLPEDIDKVVELLEHFSLPTKILIDCAHGNSNKKHFQQPIVFRDVLNQVLTGNKHIAGMMLESNLEEGNQQHPKGIATSQWGISITDSCLSWKQTEELLLEAMGIPEVFLS